MRKEFATRVSKRLRGRMAQAFSFLVATAWAEAFDAIFDLVAGESDSISRKIVYAIVFTIIASLAATLIADEHEDDLSD